MRQVTAKARQSRTHNIVNAFDLRASQERPLFTMPPRINLEAFRDEMFSRRITREPLDQTLDQTFLFFLDESIVARGGGLIGLRTLERQLHRPTDCRP